MTNIHAAVAFEVRSQRFGHLNQNYSLNNVVEWRCKFKWPCSNIANLSTDSGKNAKQVPISQSCGYYSELPFYYIPNFTLPFSRIVPVCNLSLSATATYII